MIRKAFVMSVAAGHEAEYARRHQPIWPELEGVLKTHGVHNYSIFLDERTRQLFAYAEIETKSGGPRSRKPKSASDGGDTWPTSCPLIPMAARFPAVWGKCFTWNKAGR